jgi:hypothetical protein
LPQDDARNDPAEAGPQSAARFGVEAGMAVAGLGHRAHEARVDRSRIGPHGDLHRHRRPDPASNGEGQPPLDIPPCQR